MDKLTFFSIFLVVKLSQPVQADKSTRSSKVTFIIKTFPLGESNLYQYVENKQKSRHRRIVTET